MKNTSLNAVKANRQGCSNSEISTLSAEAFIQHPFSIRSASDQHPMEPGGNQEGERFFVQAWKYVAVLLMVLTFGVGKMWGDDLGYNGQSFVYLKVNGTTKYYQVTEKSWDISAALPGTWGGGLSDQTFDNIYSLQLVGGAVGGWTNSGYSLSGTLYYAVTQSSSTPDSWNTLGSIASGNIYENNSNHCYYYKNDYSTDITPANSSTYFIHIKITDGQSNDRTSCVAFTMPYFTVAGTEAVFGSDWSATDTNNDMIHSNGTTYTLTKSNVALSTGTTYKCKVVVNHSWGEAYPNDDKEFTVDATGRYDVSVSFDASSSHTVSVETTFSTYNITLDKNGGGTDGSATVTYNNSSLSSISAPTRLNYHVEGYYEEDGSSTWGKKVATSAGVLQASTNYTDGSSKWTSASDQTLYTKWEGDSWSITYKDQGDVTYSGSNGGALPNSYTYGTGIATLTEGTKTGYNFSGWYENSNCTGDAITTIPSSATGDKTLYAKWTAKNYTITLDKQTSAGGYGGNAGTVENPSVTFDAAPTTVSGTMPSAVNGYAFMGFYSAADGGGRRFIAPDGTWVTDAGDTISSGNWVHDGAITLYAYYKKAEITTLTLDAAIVESNGTVGVTPTIYPTPTGTTAVCWRVLYNNDNPLDPQPEIINNPSLGGNKVTFTAPYASGTYKVEAVLRNGSSCDASELSTRVVNFQVAGNHTVTMKYKCGSEEIKASTNLEGIRPLVWSSIIAPPEIFGYIFSGWTAGDGVTLTDDNGETSGTSSSNEAIEIKAIYDGYLTANYTKRDYIYFKNTIGWDHVDVYFYTSDKYWDDTEYGSGSKKDKVFKNGDDENHKPYYEEKHGRMTLLEGTDIWYLDAGAIGCKDWQNIVFNANTQDNYEWFSATELVRRGDFMWKTAMFVPADKTTYTPVTKNSDAHYYSKGYWVNYLGEQTGYTLEVYDGSGSSLLKSIKFTSVDKLMPMTATLGLNASTTYKFRLKRDGNTDGDLYYGNGGTMTYDARYGHATPWEFTSGVGKCGLTTTAAGDYTFHLNYSQNSGGEYNLRISVEYPIADGDYRLIYKDNDQINWKVSSIVPKVANETDTVSFFVRPGSSPVLKIQKSSVALDGTITWNEYPTPETPTNQITGGVATTITSGGTKVYNFNISMDGDGAISVTSAEPYIGSYYIRTDAANSKWDNYRGDKDHLMTYSEYSITHGGYSHYYCHWVKTDDKPNVKFCIANDYSPSISDTLTREEATGDWSNIGTYIKSNGDLKRNANVRFMWNRNTNEISRAYVDGAQGTGSNNFLYILSEDSKIKKADGSALDDNKVNFADKGNWIYEANIKAKPDAQIKLLSNWDDSGTKITQYFKGSSSTAEALIGGSGDTDYYIRVLYDYKTNRLVAAWKPSGDINDQTAINTDVMFIREHQGDIDQLTFSKKNDKMGNISNIQTAYAVLRFNKWTLNNKDKSTHEPLASPLSRYERDLFYVSFPFRVSMEEVFGFGTYGTHWIIEEYDGAGRAKNGYWLESKPNWKFITNRNGKFFEPHQGYIIALDLDELGESSDVWTNTDQVELYFPSYGTMPTITSSSVTYTIPPHPCTIDRSGESNGHGGTLGSAYNRTIKDSHWNVLSVPTYVNINDVSFANTEWIGNTDGNLGPNFLYEWNPSDNSVSAVSGVGYNYHAMHAYLVQYSGDVTWAASVSPATAPRRNKDYRGEYEFRLELQQNAQKVDQTYIKLSDDNAVTTGFEFNYDLSKEYNNAKANIYSLIGTEPVAGNCLPLTDQPTIVPIGVRIVTDGDYTFSMPDGTEGIGITLIDNETGVRTYLTALDYTINMSAGTYDTRFILEISPITQGPMDVEMISGGNNENCVRKVMIDGILYIVKGNEMFDSRGTRVK